MDEEELMQELAEKLEALEVGHDGAMEALELLKDTRYEAIDPEDFMEQYPDQYWKGIGFAVYANDEELIKNLYEGFDHSILAEPYHAGKNHYIMAERMSARQKIPQKVENAILHGELAVMDEKNPDNEHFAEVIDVINPNSLFEASPELYRKAVRIAARQNDLKRLEKLDKGVGVFNALAENQMDNLAQLRIELVDFEKNNYSFDEVKKYLNGRLQHPEKLLEGVQCSLEEMAEVVEMFKDRPKLLAAVLDNADLINIKPFAEKHPEEFKQAYDLLEGNKARYERIFNKLDLFIDKVKSALGISDEKETQKDASGERTLDDIQSDIKDLSKTGNIKEFNEKLFKLGYDVLAQCDGGKNLIHLIVDNSELKADQKVEMIKAIEQNPNLKKMMKFEDDQGHTPFDSLGGKEIEKKLNASGKGHLSGIV